MSDMTQITVGEFDPAKGDAKVVAWDNVHVSGTLSLLVGTGIPSAPLCSKSVKVTLDRKAARALRDRLDEYLEETEVGGEDAHLEAAYEDRFTVDGE